MEAEPGIGVNSTPSPPEISTDLPAENKDVGLSSTVLPENYDNNLAGQLTWTQGPWFDTHRVSLLTLMVNERLDSVHRTLPRMYGKRSDPGMLSNVQTA